MMKLSETLRAWREAEAGRPAKRHGKIQPRRTVRRGDVVDREYTAWLHENFGCMVAGKRADSPCWGVGTQHHLRHITHPDGRIERTGRNDYRSGKLCEGHHVKGCGPHAVHEMTGDHGKEWERFFGVSWETEIARYNAEWVRSGGKMRAA